MKNNHYTVLLTGTIDTSVFNNVGNVITDVNDRLHQYEQSIKKYVTDSAFDRIVFAENSGYTFNPREYEELAVNYSKTFEYVKCPSYISETIQYGKSYGESRLITDAIEASNILKKSDKIYKLTGRIYLKNSFGIVKTYKKHKNEFLVIENDKWCYTNIFKISINDYQKFLADSYIDIMKNRMDIEHTFFSRIKKTNMDIGSFKVWPVFEGRMGGNNRPYSGSWKGNIYKSILCKMQCYKINSRTSKLSHF